MSSLQTYQMAIGSLQGSHGAVGEESGGQGVTGIIAPVKTRLPDDNSHFKG